MCQFCGHADEVERIHSMLQSSEYEWARATLRAVQAIIIQARHITPEQRHEVASMRMRGEP